MTRGVVVLRPQLLRRIAGLRARVWLMMMTMVVMMASRDLQVAKVFATNDSGGCGVKRYKCLFGSNRVVRDCDRLRCLYPCTKEGVQSSVGFSKRVSRWIAERLQRTLYYSSCSVACGGRQMVSVMAAIL
ncbi:hypothetical protein BCV70DRAFT_84950 [Testicularia cyperi]|uniref:Uncharacterized protein n=1 Tax=Testicularia cyperi TaxID=1882483 RepID=A0A317XRJ2_9BASI|nr:hypothetical protein BCV70DRAFT_84950 [Testicularia cyperi]